MTSNSLSLDENEEHDNPSKILNTIFGLHASDIFYLNMCGFQYICRFLWSQTQVAELIVHIIPTE